jgi:hypothetical protein
MYYGYAILAIWGERSSQAPPREGCKLVAAAAAVVVVVVGATIMIYISESEIHQRFEM